MSTKLKAGTATSGAVIDADTTGILELQTGSTPTTAVTIDASQNVGIGTSSPASIGSGKILDIAASSGGNANLFLHGNGTSGSAAGLQFQQDGSGNAYMWNYSNAYTAFATNNAERMRIDSSGQVGIGVTSMGAKLDVSAATSGTTLGRFSNTVSPTGAAILYAGTTQTASGSAYNIIGGAASGNTFIVYTNGNVQNSNNSYGGISDERLKENIVDATPKLDKLMQVKVKNYNLIADEEKTKQIGVIAQELETVFPSLVDEDALSKMKQVKYSVFVPILIKAIQELNAKVDAQAAEIAALKGAK